MKKFTSKIVAIAIFVVAIVLICAGIYGYSIRNNENVASMLTRMRSYAVMHSAANGIIDDIALAAKKEARAFADDNGYTRNQRSAYATEQEAIARAEAQTRYLNFGAVNTSSFEGDIAVIRETLGDYYEMESAEKAVYAENYAGLYTMVSGLGDELNTIITEEYAAAALAAEESEASITYKYDMEAILAGGLSGFTAEYNMLDAQDQKVVDKLLKKSADEVLATLTATASAEETPSEGGEASDEIATDFAFFEASPALKAKKDSVDPLYASLWTKLMTVMPDLTEDMQKDMRNDITAIIYQQGDTFEKEAARYSAVKSESVFSSGDRTALTIASSGNNMIVIGVGLAIFALCIFFYAKLVKSLGMPRLVILLFLLFLCVVASLYGINVPSMLGSILKRTGMYGVLALAMLPGIQCGISLNMGMTVGIIAGLMSTMIAMEANMVGWGAFAFASILGVVFAIPIGWAYAKLLNRLKGNEMTVSTYVGFSIVSLFCIAWMLLPFRNPKLTWALGLGLRVMHNMGDSFGGILDKLWSFKIGGVNVPTGLLLFLLICCLAMWLFSRSKTGVAMIAAGSNPRFAEASGINVNKMRALGTILSTCIAAVGIIVYSQSFGFMQLYNGPKQMGFVAASAILIGGASVSRGKVSHVILGTFLFQGVLAMGIQVANAAISVGGLSEVMRILISNGIILYALTQSGGDNK